MTDTSRHDHLPPGDHRADEIHVHQREAKWKSGGPLIGAALLGLGLLSFWALRSRHEAVCGETAITFAPHGSELAPADRAALDALATCMKANSSEVVRVAGRAEPDEVARNPALPRDRAAALRIELDRLGVPDSRVMVSAGQGPCTQGSDACRTATATSEASRR